MCFKDGCILRCDSIISSHIFDVQSAEEQTCTKEIKILPLLLSLVFIRWFWFSNSAKLLSHACFSRLCNIHSNLDVYFRSWKYVIKGILKLWLQTCSCSYSCSSTLTWTSCHLLSSLRSTWSSGRWGRSRRTCPRRAPCRVERRTQQPWGFQFWRLDEFVKNSWD